MTLALKPGTSWADAYGRARALAPEAFDADRILNLIGGDTLYGRYWGCIEEVPFLHFELCFYQAIEWAIDHKLSAVQAGAQGEHKLARGYEPVITRSAHFIPNPSFRSAVADFLVAERAGIAQEFAWLSEALPYRSSSSA